MTGTSPLKLMAILAHPDDESLGLGSTLARYAAEGVETHLVTATRGQRGWLGEPSANPGLKALGEIRERELRAAAAVLGIKRLEIFDYLDGELDQADPAQVIGELVALVRRARPEVVITFGPEGAFGHPDHMAISRLTTAALVSAVDSRYLDARGQCQPHRVAKLYHMIWTAEEQTIFQAAFGDIVLHVDGAERRPFSWPEWAITSRIDTAEHWRTCWRAISCHRTQLPGYARLLDLPEAQHRALWGSQGFSRAFSLVNSGSAVERDLFDGLRVSVDRDGPNPAPRKPSLPSAAVVGDTSRT